jgi:hypothetical protein
MLAFERKVLAATAEAQETRRRAEATEAELARRDRAAVEEAREKDRLIHELKCKLTDLDERAALLAENLADAEAAAAANGDANSTVIGSMSALGASSSAVMLSSSAAPLSGGDGNTVAVASLRSDLRAASRARDELASKLDASEKRRAAAETSVAAARVDAAGLDVRVRGLASELELAQRAAEDARSAVAARDKAVASLQEGFADTQRRARAAAEKERRAAEEALRAEQAKVRAFVCLLTSDARCWALVTRSSYLHTSRRIFLSSE